MANPTTCELTPETFVTEMTTRMQTLARTLSTWVQREPRPLQEH